MQACDIYLYIYIILVSPDEVVCAVSQVRNDEVQMLFDQRFLSLNDAPLLGITTQGFCPRQVRTWPKLVIVSPENEIKCPARLNVIRIALRLAQFDRNRM